KKASDLRETAKKLPLDRILVETDSPFLAPEPLRGKRNEPANVIHTARRIAEIRGLEPDALAAATTENFKRAFCLGFEGS
ncbi:MAG: TatD family hydrolase, partial [Blastocatellia bacterium]